MIFGIKVPRAWRHEIRRYIRCRFAPANELIEGPRVEDFIISRMHGVANSRVHGFTGPRVYMFTGPRVHEFTRSLV